jgi:hypothetical protein
MGKRHPLFWRIVLVAVACFVFRLSSGVFTLTVRSDQVKRHAVNATRCRTLRRLATLTMTLVSCYLDCVLVQVQYTAYNLFILP